MAHAMANKTDPVRNVLSALIAESHSTLTPEKILREFRATADKRLTDSELLALLESISSKRINSRQVLDEITYVLERKDPMYALLKFTERITQEAKWHSNASVEYGKLPPASSTKLPHHYIDTMSIGSSSISTLSLADELHPPARKSLDLSYSTPVTSRKPDESPCLETLLTRRPSPSVPTESSSRGDLSMIKKRVMNAVAHMPVHESTNNRSANRSSLSLNGGNNTGITSNNATSIQVPSIQLSTSGGSVDLDLDFQDGMLEAQRTHMLWDYCKIEGQNQRPPAEIAAMPLESQQHALILDLIYCLSGVRGSYITPLPRDKSSSGLARYETRFTVHPGVDKALAEMVHEILPLASHFMAMQKVMAITNNRGQVNNSLNAALQDLTHDFYLLVAEAEAELDSQALTLPKLLYYLQPTMWVMEGLWSTLGEIQLSNLKGGDVLSHLCRCIKQLEGDKATQDVLISLTTKAAAPYMRMLQLWIHQGIIVDNTEEFLVVDNEVVHKGETMPEHYSDDYWEKRYTRRSHAVPTFLANHSDIILRTGKYLNVIRQCGKRVTCQKNNDAQFDPTKNLHVKLIEDAYFFAARQLLDVLLNENDLMGHLESVKRYLLLLQGDFIAQFMDACEDELSKNVDQVLPMTLENLLGLTLRLSSARSDPYKDDLHCELLTYDLVTQMSKIMDQEEEYWKTTDRLDLTGLECFAFTYEVKWPVSLVLNHIAITKYQMLFRQLFYCKHVERQLCKIWKENSMAKKFSAQAAELYRSAFTLRQRMMNAIQNLEYYMMIEIIEPNWHVFIEKMTKVENVDEVLNLHQDFLDLCLKNCMLTETSHLNRAIFKLCKICLNFCEFIQRSQRLFLDAELKSMVCDSSDESTDQSDSEPEVSDRPQDESSMAQTETFSESVKRFDLEFTGMLISFLKQINDLAKANTGDRFMNLVHRINFNSFYSEQMERMCVMDAMG
ncbi:LOW QUALITY PROTEIN: gamma-tubulin complex component 2 homolog [Drosophila nasuta]|uniref:LOW QUALITY PROTEIN: gamma-tubulin complex component 2 homolog n=1 Tax=Drosophila nasuta TaxID=42062 RepID=UPI00295E6DE2|nr:LOW QUALITY PROTEIN: gamma-tubulin complex component 2 homolog [Drosophila nasuta]